MMPSKAFILAAGYGKRLRPHTDTRPKPLVEVNGRSLIERTLDHLEKANVRDVVVNTHYLQQQITSRLQGRKGFNIAFSHEEELLDTGGGIKKMLHFFAGEPFFVLSGDGLWEDKNADFTALDALAAAWDPTKMDILILLQPVNTMVLTEGVGDYQLGQDGRAIRSRDKTGTAMFTSMRINHPRIFKDTPDGSFSYLDLLDRTEEQGRLYGVLHTGDWHHISTPADLAAVERAYKRSKAAG